MTLQPSDRLNVHGTPWMKSHKGREEEYAEEVRASKRDNYRQVRTRNVPKDSRAGWTEKDLERGYKGKVVAK